MFTPTSLENFYKNRLTIKQTHFYKTASTVKI